MLRKRPSALSPKVSVLSETESARISDYKTRLRIGDFVIDAGALSVSGDGGLQRLKPKAMAVLLALAREPGITLTREELLDQVWKKTHVTPGVLGHAVTALRRAFADALDSPRYIETIPRIGYRLIAPVSRLDEEPVGDDAPAPAGPDIAVDRLVPAGAPDAAAIVRAGASGDASRALSAADVASPDPVDMHAATYDAIDAPGAPPTDGDAVPAATLALPLAGAVPVAVSMPPPSPARMPCATADARRLPIWQRWLAIAALLALVAVAGATVLLTTRRDALPASATVPPLLVSEPRLVTFATGSETNPRLNAAGDWLAYTASASLGAPRQLILQSVFGTDPLPLPTTGVPDRPTWSPDGRRIAYVSQTGTTCTIRTVSIDDVSAQTVGACADRGTVYLDWSPADAGLIALTSVEPGATGGSSIQLMRDSGGWHRQALRYDRPAADADLFPRFSPDGKWIAFRRGTNPNSDLYRMSVDGGTVTRLTRVRAAINGFSWLPDGSGLVFSSNHDGTRQLYRVDLADQVISPLDVLNASSPDVAARSGRMIYQADDWTASLSELDIASGQRRAVTTSSGRDTSAAVSADGHRVIFVSNRDNSPQLWSLNVADGQTTRLTRHVNMSVDAPVLSPDGGRVLYITRARGGQELWEFTLADSSTQRLQASSASIGNAVYASDGRAVWYTRWQGSRWALFTCIRTTSTASCRSRETPLTARRVERTRLDGRERLLLASPLAKHTLQIVDEQGLQPAGAVPLPESDSWAIVGDAIWSLDAPLPGDPDMMTLTSRPLDGGAPRMLASIRGAHPLPYTGFAVTADRRHVVLPDMTRDGTDLAIVTLSRPARHVPASAPR